MAILITGSTGFVGKNLLPYLKSVLDENISGLNLRSNWSNEIGADVKTIIHLAGKAHDLKQTSEPEAYYSVNYNLTKELYDTFLNSGAKCFIFVSSVKAAADKVKGILSEDIVPSPETHYGKSKLMAEEYILAQPLPKGKYFYILRPCMIHGPGNKGNLNLLYKFVQKGIPYPLAAFDNKRSFLSVNNLCFVIKELLLMKAQSGIYNVADDEVLSTNEVVSVLAKSIGKKPRLWAIPESVIKGIAKLGDKLGLPLTTERLDKLTEDYIVSNVKIINAIKKPLPLSVREGLENTANSFQEVTT